MTNKKGPYVNEDQDQLYLPVSDWTYNEARSEAATWASEFSDDLKSKYYGKIAVPLHDHEDWEYCEECPEILAWCFDILPKKIS